MADAWVLLEPSGVTYVNRETGNVALVSEEWAKANPQMSRRATDDEAASGTWTLTSEAYAETQQMAEQDRARREIITSGWAH